MTTSANRSMKTSCKIGELRRVKDHFAKFVPDAVKRLVAANPEAPELAKKHERDVSVLFLDISGYTRWTFTASGPVTNPAARLAGLAEASQVLVGPETVQRLGGRYRLERLGREYLKNIAEPVDIHRILGPSART